MDENAVYYGSDDFLWRLSSVFEGAKLLPALKNKTDIMAKFNKLKPFAFDASWLSLTKEIVDEIHQLGVKVFTDLLGPLDTEINYIKAREMGVDLIQTDRMLVVQKHYPCIEWIFSKCHKKFYTRHRYYQEPS